MMCRLEADCIPSNSFFHIRTCLERQCVGTLNDCLPHRSRGYIPLCMYYYAKELVPMVAINQFFTL